MKLRKHTLILDIAFISEFLHYKIYGCSKYYSDIKKNNGAMFNIKMAMQGAEVIPIKAKITKTII